MNIVKSGMARLMDANRDLVARMNRNFEVLGQGRRVTHPKHDPVAYREIEMHRDAFEKLEVFSNNLNAAGSTVRVAMASMDMSDSNLRLMEQKLRDAVFYPAGSTERENHLREYDRLLPLLDDIARSPDDGARRLLDSPDNYASAGDIFVNAGSDGLKLTLRAQPIHVGEDGLNVKALDDPAATTDEQIREHLDALELARGTLLEKRKALGIDASTIEKSITFNKVIVNQNKSAAERMDQPDLNREAILATALGVRRDIAINGISALSSNAELALQLLR